MVADTSAVCDVLHGIQQQGGGRGRIVHLRGRGGGGRGEGDKIYFQ
jgi:hypothetical protein